jgi:hypothetical protein
MAYRAPRYSYVHAARDVGAGEITLSHAADADFPVSNLIDDRAQTLFKFNSSNESPYINIDLGAGFAELDRLIIPANHNLENVRVRQDVDSGYGSMNGLTGNVDTTPGIQIDMEFTATHDERYIRVEFNSTAQHYLPQIVLTKIQTLTVGPDIADSPDAKIDNVTRLEQNTGQSPTIQHGPQQRVIEYEYESPLSGADLTAMDAHVNSVGMHRPFWVDPAAFTPFTDEPVLWMKFADMPRSDNSILVPMVGARSKTYRLSLIESLD